MTMTTTTPTPSLPVIVIGGVYEYNGKPWTMFYKNHDSGFCYIARPERSLNLPAGYLTGPIAMPCPVCGAMQSVKEELAQHLSGCGKGGE